MRKKTGLLLAMLFAALSVPVSGQEVILLSREVSVRTALSEIERQTDYRLAVNWENLDAEKKVLFSANHLSVTELLEQVFDGTPLKWEFIGNTIAIVRSDPPTAERPEHLAASAMYRTQLPSEMKVVPDPYSRRQISVQEISRIASGQWSSGDETVQDSIGMVMLNFRVNSTLLERDYMDNARALEIIHHTFSDKDLLTAMDFITVTAAASPEGNTANNDRLASNRALAVKSYIMGKYPFMNRERIFTFSIGEDWTGLRKMVVDDPYAPYRREVLQVLDTDLDSDTKRAMLRSVGGGSAYRYIAQNMLPRLRGAAACMIYYKRDPEPVVITETQTLTQTDTVYIDRVETIVERVVLPTPTIREPYYWAIKTNLLYDAALLPDLAVEFSLGRKFSLEFGGQWSWWTSDKSHKNIWRIQTAGIEPRLWLGDREKRTPLSGHFLGLYGMVGTYDVRYNGETGYLSDMSYSAGLSYGFSTRLSRSWNLEFGLSVGYMSGEYEIYHIYNEPNDEFYRDGRATKHYFGPTKARISLVWLPGGKNPRRK